MEFRANLARTKLDREKATREDYSSAADLSSKRIPEICLVFRVAGRENAFLEGER
jgi:hypothetical protein